MKKITISTETSKEIIDITDRIDKLVDEKCGVCHLFLQHTSAALSTADLDPGGTDQDYLNAWQEIVPALDYNHPHDPEHMPDHILATTIGPSVTVPLQNGKLQLGRWQRIVLCEFNGPRERTVTICTTD